MIEKIRNIEFIVLIFMWFGALLTYPFALANNFTLFYSDYIGLAGLLIVSLIAIFKPKEFLLSLLILLLLGLFNVATFVYYINVTFSFGFSIFVTPGLQLFSLVLLILLGLNRKLQIIELYQELFDKTKEKKEQQRQSEESKFKEKFEKLSDQEIDYRLQQDMVPAAIAALKLIKEERKEAQD